MHTLRGMCPASYIFIHVIVFIRHYLLGLIPLCFHSPTHNRQSPQSLVPAITTYIVTIQYAQHTSFGITRPVIHSWPKTIIRMCFVMDKSLGRRRSHRHRYPRQGLILVMYPTETVQRDDTMWCNSKE